jgi:hypothetical protein
MYSNSSRSSFTAGFLGFILLILAAANPTFACPLGPGETRMELSRVMRNFGRLLLNADQIAREGASSPQLVTDQQLATAIEGIRLAQSCAQVAIEANSDELLPIKVAQMRGPERDRYLQKYRAYMGEFASTLAEYKNIFEIALRTEKERRDFSRFKMKRDEVRERANKAHTDL